MTPTSAFDTVVLGDPVKHRLSALIALTVALVAAIVAFPAASWAADSPPVNTIPGPQETHRDDPLTFSSGNSNALATDDPQGYDLGVQLSVNHGKLTVDNPPNGNSCPVGPPNGIFCFTTNNGTNIVGFRGTEAQIAQALQSVTYTPDAGYPAGGQFPGIDKLTFSSTQQIGNGALQTVDTVDITVQPLNTAPFFVTVPDAVNGVSTDENTTYDFTNDIEVDDADECTVTHVLTVTVDAGTLSTSYVAADFTSTPNGLNTLQMEGSLNDLNNGLDLMDYHPVANSAYQAIVSLLLEDPGNAGNPPWCWGSPSAPAAAAFPINVLPDVATHFSVTGPATTDPGTPFLVTVKALDQFDQVDTNYAGTVDITSSDNAAVLPSASGLVAGAGTFSVTLTTPGDQTVTATDMANMALTGTSDPIAVEAPQVVDHFDVVAPASAVAGSSFSYTVTAKDSTNATVTDYAGTVSFHSSDTGATLPADAMLTNGTGSFDATLFEAGAQTITAEDTVMVSVDGTSNTITVDPAAASDLVVSAPASATVGTAVNVSITAEDPYGNVATSYSGLVHLTSSDGAATLAADAMLTNGVGTRSVTFGTAGNQTVTATDTVSASVNGTSGVVVVDDVPVPVATHFTVSAPASAVAGTPVNVSITARDASDVVVPGYAGIVHLTSSDPQAALPADLVLVNGTAVVSVTFGTVGARTVTAADTVAPLISGTSGPVQVSAGVAVDLLVAGPAAATAGTPTNVIVTAVDAFANTATGYAGVVHFTSTDGAALLPADSGLVNGTGTFPVTLSTVGDQTVTATDSVTMAVNGTSGPISVSAQPPGPATHFVVSAPASTTAGVQIMVTVTAEDAGNGLASGYSGTVHLTSSDGSATLAADATLTNGVGTFPVTLVTSGLQTVTATDTSSASIAGTTADIDVAAGAPKSYKVSPPPAGSETGSPVPFSVIVVDAFGNTVTTYSGTANLTSSDPAAVLPAEVTFVNGVATFDVTFLTAGPQVLEVHSTTGPVLEGASPEAQIVEAPTETTVTPPTTPDTTAGPGTTDTTADGSTSTTQGVGSSSTVAPTSVVPGSIVSTTLPLTGAASGVLAAVGAILLLAGLSMVALARSQSRR